MKQRPQYMLEAFARAGHDVYFVDQSAPRSEVVDGVRIVSSMRDTPYEGVIVYTHFAPIRELIAGLTDAAVVYDILDDLSIFDADEVGLPAERTVRYHHDPFVEGADVVIGSAPVLVERHRPERADMLLIENGVDVGKFANGEPRADIGRMSGAPIVGYHGMISRWFDFDLMTDVASGLPDHEFVFVGPVDPRSRQDADRLESLANVSFIGELPSDDMPSVVASFDVGVVPFVIDDMTRGVSPLKMYEYLAGGKPVVATPLPLCVEHPLVDTAAEAGEFAEHVRAAVLNSRDSALVAARKASAAEADWVVRVQPLIERLDALSLRRVRK